MIIKKNISCSYTFCKKNTYIILGKIHVLKNVKLTVENGTNIHLVNGPMKSSLIFDKGSQLFAKNIYIKACNSKNYKPIKFADNGGICFNGSIDDLNDNIILSNFTVNKIHTYYLGSFNTQGILVQDIKLNEWNISSVESYNSACNGFYIKNSKININNLKILNSYRDGLILIDSLLNIIKTLEIKMLKSGKKYNKIFNINKINAETFLKFESNCIVNISGIFGDNLKLISSDLCQPEKDKYYLFNKCCQEYSLIFPQNENQNENEINNSFIRSSLLTNIIEHVKIFKNMLQY